MHKHGLGREALRGGLRHQPRHAAWIVAAGFSLLIASSVGAFQLHRTAFSSGAVVTGDSSVTLLGTIGETGGVIGTTGDSNLTLSQGFWFSIEGAIVDVDDSLPTTPAVNAITHAAPNPFPTGTAITYSVAAEETVRLRIFDVTGRTVKSLVNAPHAVGTHSVAWDGRDDAGRSIGSGVYYVRIQIGDWSETRKVLKLR